MNVVVTTFRNPFSFFCLPENAAINAKDIVLSEDEEGPLSSRVDLSGVSHGQYIAIMWKNNWARGIVTLETQFRVWLIDYGIYVRPDDKTVYVNLPVEYRKYPTKVFEASIHGVIPVQKVLNEMCQLEDELSATWMDGAIKKAKGLISSADSTLFVPITIFTTKCNNVVLGDLYIKKGKQTINLVDELEQFPVFLKKKPQVYVEKLSVLYKNRRQHRACLLKPEFPNKLPEINTSCSLDEYSAICATATALEQDNSSEEGSTITYLESRATLADKNAFKLTAKEIEHYANRYITVSGREYNVLNVLLNKARDLYMCEQYKDAKPIGRANSRLPRTKPDRNDVAGF